MTATREIARSREPRLVETFVELADSLVEDFDVVEFFASLAERVVQLGLASEAGILLVDETGDLQFVAASRERTHLLELFQVQNQEGPCQDSFTTGTPVSADDLDAASDRWPLFAPRAVSTGFRSVQAVPLHLRGTVLGAFNLFVTEPGGIDPAAKAVVQAMADVATIGLLQQRELDRAHAVEGQLQQALQTRIGIEQAKGIISEQMEIPMDATFVLLRGFSRNHNQKLHDVARDVVSGVLAANDLTERYAAKFTRPPKGKAMTEDQRDEIRSVLEDLRAEEDEQRAERGHASNRLLRAGVRLEQLLERSDAEVTGIGHSRS